MSDDAQIARLTELAQKVFEARRFGRVMMLTDGGVDVVNEAGGLLASIATHPRALDALEAALLVLAGEDRLSADEREYVENMRRRRDFRLRIDIATIDRLAPKPKEDA